LTLRYLLAECERQPELTELRELFDELDVMARLDEMNTRKLGAAGERDR
jgi:hypothetical protein